jgi:hypothetical protein
MTFKSSIATRDRTYLVSTGKTNSLTLFGVVGGELILTIPTKHNILALNTYEGHFNVKAGSTITIVF